MAALNEQKKLKIQGKYKGAVCKVTEVIVKLMIIYS